MDYQLRDQQTVQVRVQVVDMNAFTLDLRVPTYLPARDLTQRIARDAGLDAYWPDGKRRLYWLRARGRLLQDTENLGDLTVINGELVYLLPQPPAGSGVLEQPPDYPENRGYAGKGTATLVGSVLGVFVWAAAWGTALSVERTAWTVLLPGLGMGLLCCSFARHAWGGQGSAPRVAVTAVFLFLVILAVTMLAPLLITGESVGTVYAQSAPGLITGLLGVMMGWLAWWGAVEPLPPMVVAQQAAVQQEQVLACGLCGQAVSGDVRYDCQYGCGRAFHVGCYKAKMSVYRGDPRICGVCNARVG